MNKNGLINKGDWTNIKNVMNRAKKGEPISTLFLGGSITQGSLSSTQDLCYASLVYKWWVDKFPSSKVTLINAGIGGTTSQFGVSRVYQHALSKNPDFMLTEFAVNDDNNEFFKETYEGLIRKIISSDNAPALMLMNNAWFDSGNNAEDIHLPIAKHYDIPMVSMKSTIWPSIKSGELIKEDLSPDMLHPNDAGHKLISEVIIDFLEEVYATCGDEDDILNKCIYDIKDSLTANAYENSVRIKNYNMDDFSVSMDGFNIENHEKKEFLDIFSGGFTGSKVGDAITFKTECTGLAIQYKKTINLPAPIAKAVVDGDEENAIILDANFDETWGDCLYIETVAKHMELSEHEVKIIITEAHEDDKVPFYLVSVIASR